MTQYTKQDLQILEEPFVEIRKKVTILLRMGCLLSENGANANQIVRDMRRAAAYMGIPEDYLHIHIAYSNILSISMVKANVLLHSARYNIWGLIWKSFLPLVS